MGFYCYWRMNYLYTIYHFFCGIKRIGITFYVFKVHKYIFASVKGILPPDILDLFTLNLNFKVIIFFL